ncbi:MAG TPA: chemotaxis response regulator protein-glutamate methylesterase [Bacillota bacterium]|nr:chemotaxis response regulator protein-glutamate methylesterase [Bacillota bacterium]
MNVIRVLIIEDSAFMRRVLKDILNNDDRMEVIATARNGADGLLKIKQFQPDVITLDVEMPQMDGITCLEEIMNRYPTPVVMLSSEVEQGKRKTLKAMSLGAVDFIAKPSGQISLDIDKMRDEIVHKVLTAAVANVKQVNDAPTYQKAPLAEHKVNYKPKGVTMIATGASTGGPRALQKVLEELPNGFSTPILIVQHMPEKFTTSLANRLNALSDMLVKEAVNGELIQPKTVYIAPGNFHMKIRMVGRAYAIELTQETLVNGHRPSVDVLFRSLKTLSRVNKIAVILTGMGSDGANGVHALKQTDPQTIILAESKSSAIVYGMPKAAVQTNTVNHIVPLQQMGKLLTNIVGEMGE